MRKEVIFFYIFVFFISIGLCQLSVENINLEKDYFLFDQIDGNITLNITNEPIDLNMTLGSYGNTKNILKLILEEGQPYTCYPNNCEPNYVLYSTSTEKSLLLSYKNETIAFSIKGENGHDLIIKDIKFNFTTDFKEQFTRPLSISFFDHKYDWNFSEFSSSKFSEPNYSCFNPLSSNVFSNFEINNSQKYCSILNLEEPTTIIKVGLNKTGEDTKDITINVYKETDTIDTHSSTCDIHKDETECNVSSFVNPFSPGKYYVCVSSNEDTTNYFINIDPNNICGLIKTTDQIDENKKFAGFAIYTRHSSYADASKVKLNYNEIKTAANNYLSQVYSNNCSDTCVLPFVISSQNTNQIIKINNIIITYSEGGMEDKTSNLIGDPIIFEPIFNYTGTLNLSNSGLNIVSNPINFIISNSTSNLYTYSKSINLIVKPTIEGILPLRSIPINYPITFSPYINYPTEDLTYEWKILNHNNQKTTTGNTQNLSYTFSEPGEYKIFLTIRDGEYNDTKNQTIIVIAPTIENLKNSFKEKYDEFKEFLSKLYEFPLWYQDPYLYTKIGIDTIQKKFDDINSSINKAELTQAQITKYGGEIYSMNIPTNVYFTEVIDNFQYVPPEKIDLSIIKDYLNLSVKNYKDYEEEVINWNNKYIISNYSSGTVKYDMTKLPIFGLRYYDINIKSTDIKPSYLVINKSVKDLHLGEENYDFKTLDKYPNYSILKLSPNKKTNIKFYIETDEKISWFVSPDFSELLLSNKIVNYCDHDGICNEDGETFLTCPSDCLSTKKLILYIVLVIFGFIFIYTILQQWYSTNYENKLFRDKTQLQNLVAFINSGKETGLSNSDIRKKLLIEGWSGERISYAFKKAYGKSIMPEIIPISKIKDKIRFSPKATEKKKPENNKQGAVLYGLNGEPLPIH